MRHYAGLDVSVKETSVCIVDETGKICREIKVVSHPEDLVRVLRDAAWHLERIGLEAGPLSQWPKQVDDVPRAAGMSSCTLQTAFHIAIELTVDVFHPARGAT